MILIRAFCICASCCTVNLSFRPLLIPILRYESIVDTGYKGLSDTLSVNSAYKISKMALLFAKSEFEVAFSSRLRTSILKIGLRTSILKIFAGPTVVDPIVDNWLLESVECVERFRYPCLPLVNSQNTLL